MSNIANIQEIIRRLQTDVTAPLFWKQNMVKLLEGCAVELQQKDARISELTKLYNEAVEIIRTAEERMKADEAQYKNIKQLIIWARQIQNLVDENRIIMLPWPREIMATTQYRENMVINENIYGKVMIDVYSGGDEDERETGTCGNAGNAMELGTGAGHDSGV